MLIRNAAMVHADKTINPTSTKLTVYLRGKI